MKRLITLGIDYGTSFSKIVLRDYGAPGGEKAHLLRPSNNFRIPSAVGVVGSNLVFGSRPPQSTETDGGVWHESIKMRVVEEIKGDGEKYFYGPRLDLPVGLTANDLAVLTVWFLISTAIRGVKEYIGSSAADVTFNLCLGVPMRFFNDPGPQQSFLAIARTARDIYQQNSALPGPTIPLERARRLLDSAYDSVSKKVVLPDSEIRGWIRSEAEAALWWPFRSPSIEAGPYVQIDIGAGTTNLSMFRLASTTVDGQWVRERIAFFGADSLPAGMDAIDRALADWKGQDEANCLALRGVERSLFATRGAVVAVSSVLGNIHDAYKAMVAKASATHMQAYAERQRWRTHKIFFLGGGSEIPGITDWLRRSPLADNERYLHVVAPQEKPHDLSLGSGTAPRGVLSHIAVAYGLANLSADLPKAETPREVPPMSEHQPGQRQSARLLDIDEWRY